MGIWNLTISNLETFQIFNFKLFELLISNVIGFQIQKPEKNGGFSLSSFIYNLSFILKNRSKLNEPFKNQTQIDLSKSRHVWISNPLCSIYFGLIRSLSKICPLNPQQYLTHLNMKFRSLVIWDTIFLYGLVFFQTWLTSF